MSVCLRVLLIGEESAGIRTLGEIARAGHRIAVVMATPPQSSNGFANLWSAASQLGYRTLEAKLVKDPEFAAVVRSERIDLLLNVHSLFVIRPEILEAVRIGAYNVHPGPLPQYAGLNTVSWAVYRGESSYGVTVHAMEAAIDTGQIAYQSFFPIETGDTALSLYSKCLKAGMPLMRKLLEAAAADPASIPRIPQDLTKRQYFGRQVPEQGRLCWSRPAREILNFIRACDYSPFVSPWGHPKTTIGDREVAILKASRTGAACDRPPGVVGEPTGSGVCVASADEWVLVEQAMVGQERTHAAELFKTGERLNASASTASS